MKLFVCFKANWTKESRWQRQARPAGTYQKNRRSAAVAGEHGYQNQSYYSQGYGYVEPQGHGRSYGSYQGQGHSSYGNGYSNYGNYGYASNRHARRDYRREVRHARRDARRYNEHGYNH
ncbi:hypothetical protein [Sphingopyxis indica]|uniref:hypothetical protein n=1 Tax=Sphingopyxis indica TaxID=436663 RepID=UPI001130D287|nr:hypothetical protein [Sphingopyxis indica]